MRGRTYTKLRETTFDLYTEQERLPWYFKFLSIFSSWLVLAGYILFSIAYVSRNDDLRISPPIATGIAATGVFLGYLSAGALAFLSRSLIFTFDGVLLPILTASAVGVFSTVIHKALSRIDGPGNMIYLFLPLAVSGVATIVSAVLSFIVYRKLRKIKDLDQRRRVHVPLDNQSSPFLSQNVSREVRDMVPDDEAQRRQLMALLQAQADGRGRDSSVDGSSTYRIGLPGDEARGRSGSVPSHGSTNRTSKFTISNLVGRERSDTAGNFKDPRERRREEIERSGLVSGSQPNSAGLTAAWSGQSRSPPLGTSPRYNS